MEKFFVVLVTFLVDMSFICFFYISFRDLSFPLNYLAFLSELILFYFVNKLIFTVAMEVFKK